MTRGPRTFARSVLTASLVLAACRNHERHSEAERATPIPSASDAIPSAPSPSTTGSLPEDPIAGAKSAAQWREHLAHEERERRLGYDRRKLPEHREVLKALRGARSTYDRAGSERAVRSAEESFRATLPKLERRFDAIDHWGNSSKVLP